MTTIMNIIALLAVSGMFIFHILSVTDKKYSVIFTVLTVISHIAVIAPILYYKKELSLLVMLYMAALAVRVLVYALSRRGDEK